MISVLFRKKDITVLLFTPKKVLAIIKKLGID